MGAFLDKPKIEKHNETGHGNNLRYGLSSMQGWRVEMEDAHTAIVQLPEPLKDWSFFAVFDGHAGAKVSAYCAEQLVYAITGSDEFQGVIKTENGQERLENVKKGIKSGFLNLDSKMREMPDFVSGEEKSGSTAVGVLISQEMCFFANCGDSRAILCRDGQVEFFTEDHKPFHPQERERIQNAGGSVMIQRVNGSLAVSRALGDFEYKNVEGKGPCEQLVSPEPEIYLEERKGSEEFLVLACDGIWDVMSNEEVCAFIRDRMTVTDDLKEICNQVIDTCLHKGSRDNMSIVIVAFEHAPRVTDEAKKRESELDELLEQKVKEALQHLDEPQDTALLSAIMTSLSSEDIPNLPPGGGLHAKRTTILEILKKLRPQTDVNDE